MSKENTPTPHIGAEYGAIAPTVIMSGDPLRAKYMADNFLENPVQYNAVRGMLGFTGTYKGKRISVQGHGMGIPSMAIYSHELFNFYDVQTIIRVGTCGTPNADVKLGNIVLAQSACTDSVYGYQYDLPPVFCPTADFDLLRAAAQAAERMGKPYQVGTVMSSDVFYETSGKQLNWCRNARIAGVEMEAYALYVNAMAAGRRALTIVTVTDNIITRESLDAETRQNGMRDMIELAFDIA